MGAIDARYVSRYGQTVFALGVYESGVLADAIGAVTATLKTLPMHSGDAPVTLFAGRVATHTDTGIYEITLISSDTQDQGFYTLTFNYTTTLGPQVYGFDVEVGPSAPKYDALPAGWKEVVERVWTKFADIFDSPMGGPNLQTYFQSNFGRNRLATLAQDTVDTMNMWTRPHKTYTFDQNFPFLTWGGLAVQGLYIETMKHLMRSYLEQPELVLSTSVSRTDRRDYFNRWQTMLDTETADWKLNLDRLKQDAIFGGMGGAVHALVSGGAYGNFGPYAMPGGAGEAAARGYYFIGRWH